MCEAPDYFRQQSPRPEQIHLHCGHGFLLHYRDFGDGPFFHIEKVDGGSFVRIQSGKRMPQQINAAFCIEPFLKGRRLGEPPFFNSVEIFSAITPPPVIADGIPDNLAEECTRVSDFELFPKRFYRLQRRVLVEIFIV
jgi:hypothetical protein